MVYGPPAYKMSDALTLSVKNPNFLKTQNICQFFFLSKLKLPNYCHQGSPYLHKPDNLQFYHKKIVR